MGKGNHNIVLKAEHLQVGYIHKKESLVVSGPLDFSLASGKLIGLIGANGVGKSTLLRTLAGMQVALNGKVLITEKEITQINPLALAQKLSIVLTEPPASKNVTAFEFVALGRQPYTNWIGSLSNNDLHEIKHALKITETADLQHKKCYELSDGQLQRVAIARALAQDTPLILMDEPTTHLDLYHRISVLKLLQKLTREANKTILFSTHEIDLAIQSCDQLLVLTNEGFEFGTPSELDTKRTFHSLFPQDGIRFDSKNNRFIISD